MKKIINYQVVKRDSLNALVEIIKAGFPDNWQPIGGISVVETGSNNMQYEYYQAIVQYEQGTFK
jgi:hypothetical protein